MALITLLCLAPLADQVQAQTTIIYQDNFARTGLLSGSTPDTADTGGAVWYAPTNVLSNAAMLTDGSEICITNYPNPTNGYYLNGYLPFTPAVGHVYTLTENLFGKIGGNQWLAMGFSLTELTNNFFAAANGGAGWLLVRASGANYQPFPGPGTADGTTVNLTGGAITNAFKIVLDTTTGNASAGWTITFYCNGVQGYQFVYTSGNPAIRFVGCGADGATGYEQDFKLTDYAAPPTAPVITETPQNVTAGVGQTATFWVNANGAPTPACQWLTNNSIGGPTGAIVGATNATYTTPTLTTLYNGLQYSVVLTNISGSITSAPATLTVVNLKPTVYSAEKSTDLAHAVVVFSEAVDPATGLNAANYTLNNGASVSSASYGSVSNSVVLTTSALNTNFLYNLTVQNVNDLFGNTATNTTLPLLPAGLAIYLRADSGIVLDDNGSVAEWIDQTTNGNNVVQYTGGNAARPTPSTINNAAAVNFYFNGTAGDYLTATSSPSLAITGPMTIYTVVNISDLSAPREILSKSVGSIPSPYDYYVNASSGTEVLTRGNGQNLGSFTSTSGASAGVAQVLAVTGSTNTGIVTHYLNGITNGSGTLTVGAPSTILDLGHPLYIGGRGDLQQWMNGTMGEVMIYNGILSAADRTNVDNYLGIKYCNFAITTDLPSTLTTSNGYAVTYNFSAGQGSAHLAYQWQENGTNIPGATGASYTTPILGPSDNGDQFDVEVVFFDGTTTNSSTNTLTVLTSPPFVVSAGIALWNTNSIVVLFNEAVDPATATMAANYSLNNGATVLSAAMGDAPNKVVLTTTPLTWNANPGYYTLTVQNVNDLYGNTIVAASPSVGLYPTAAVLWVKAAIGVTTNADGTVTGWNDLTGNGNNLQQATLFSMLEPVLTNSPAGNPVVHFVVTNATVGYINYGSGLYAPNSPTLAIAGDMSVAEVVSFSTPNFGAGQGEVIGKTGSSNPNIPAPYDYDVASTGPTLLRGNGNTANGSYGSYKATITVSTNKTHIVEFSQGGNIVSHYLDSQLAGTGVLGANGGGNYNMANCADQGQPLFVGNRGDYSKYNAEHLGGDVSELVIVSSALSSNDLASLNSYFAAEYNLPVGTNAYPAITQGPVAVTNVYQSTTLTVPTTESGNPLSFQWYSTNNVAVAGQTSPTLVITNVQATNAYYLVVTNTFGSVVSSTVVVNVIPVNTNPTNIVVSVSGGTNLVLNWPPDHTGWELQAETNSLAVGIKTNWVKVASSITTNQAVIPISRTNGSVFYRLVFPPQ